MAPCAARAEASLASSTGCCAAAASAAATSGGMNRIRAIVFGCPGPFWACGSLRGFASALQPLARRSRAFSPASCVASLPETALEFIVRLARMVAMTLRRARQRCAMLLGPCSLAFAGLLLLPRGARALILPRTHASAAMPAPVAARVQRPHAFAALPLAARMQRRRRTALHAEADKDECVTIKFVTGNAMKLREVEEILGMNGLPLPLEMIDIDLDELQEAKPEKIAAAKA